MTKHNSNKTKADTTKKNVEQNKLDAPDVAVIPAADMEVEVSIPFIDVADDREVGKVERMPVQTKEVGAEAPSEEPTAPVDEAARWPLSVWSVNVLKMIGQPAHVLAGAMVGQDPEAQYTEAEVRSLVEKFLNTPAR